jgi:hypothetical protein
MAGKGTLAPFVPYRHARDPMYAGVFLVLSGETILLGSPWTGKETGARGATRTPGPARGGALCPRMG